MGYIEKGRAKTLTKIILWLVVISFIATIFVTWGAQRSGIQIGAAKALSINGANVTPNDIVFYGKFYRILLEWIMPRTAAGESGVWLMSSLHIGQQLAGSVAAYSSEDRNDQNLRGIILLVGDTVLSESARAAGMRIGDEELKKLLAEANTDSEGKFLGRTELKAVLQYYGISEDETEAFKEALRRHLLARNYIGTLFASMQQALEADVRDAYEAENIEVSFQYAEFGALNFLDTIEYTADDLRDYLAGHLDEFLIADMLAFDRTEYINFLKTTPGEIKEEEIKSHYEDNKNNYMEPEERDIRRILVRVDTDEEADEEAIAAAEAEAKAKIDEIYRRLKIPGTEFDQVLRQFSQDPSVNTEEGIISGLTRDAARDERFINTVFDLKIEGEFNEEAVRTDDGFEIIQVVKITPGGAKPLEEVRGEIIDEVAEDRAERESKEKTEELHAKAAKEDWEELSLPVYIRFHRPVVSIEGEEEIFALGIGLQELGTLYDVEGLRKTKQGELTEVMMFEEGYAFCRVEAAGTTLTERFESLRPALIRRYTKIESRKRALAKGQDFAAKVAGVTDPEAFGQAAEEIGVSVLGATTNRSNGRFGYGKELMDKAFEADPPAVIGPLEQEEKFFVLLVTDRTEFDEEDFQRRAGFFRTQLINRWLQELRFRSSGINPELLGSGGPRRFGQLLESQISYLVTKSEVLMNREILSSFFGGGGAF